MELTLKETELLCAFMTKLMEPDYGGYVTLGDDRVNIDGGFAITPETWTLLYKFRLGR